MSTHDDLRTVLKAMLQKAMEQGIHVVRGYPRLLNYPQVEWEREWTEYLDVAQLAGAALLYLYDDPFILERENVLKVIGQKGEVEKQRIPALPILEDDEDQWLSSRLMEQTNNWSSYNQQIGHIECLWFKEGVGHHLTLDTEWYLAYNEAVERAFIESDGVEEENRRVRKKEQAVELMKRAEQLARHERFEDASSSEKRQFMAGQIFPDLALDPYSLSQVVSLAEMIYWWEIEPGMRSTKIQKARDLRMRGESIKNIAAILKMSDAKVRAAIELVDSQNRLITDIKKEMQRVWGSIKFNGDGDQYEWLNMNYGISEEDDVRWQLILEKNQGELDEDHDPENLAFLRDDIAIEAFLTRLLQKYRSNTIPYSQATNL